MNRHSIPANMEFLCQDQNLKRKLKFPNQLIQLNNQGQVDFKRTLQMNDPLRITLLDCIVILVDGESEIFLGALNSAVITSPSNSLTFPLSSAMRSSKQIEISFLRLPLKPQEQIITTLVKQQIPHGASSASNSSGTILTGSTQTTPFAGSVQSQLKKRKLETLQTLTLVSSSSCPGVERQNQPRKRQKLSLALDQDEEEDDSQQKQLKSHFSEVGNDILNHETSKSKKSQERTIGEALQMVVLWRKRQDFYKNQSISKDFQQVAEEIGISKKTLDYYYLELRSAEYFHFDFDKNLHNKMGMLREFVSQAKKTYRKQYSSNKIPRQSQLKYQISEKQIEKVNQHRENKHISQVQQLQFEQTELEEQERRKQQGKELQNHQFLLHQHHSKLQHVEPQQKIMSQELLNIGDSNRIQINSQKDKSCFLNFQYPQHQTHPPISQPMPEQSLEQQNNMPNYQQHHQLLHNYPKQQILHINNQYQQRPFSEQNMNQRNNSQNNSNYPYVSQYALNNQSGFQEAPSIQNKNWYPIRHYQELQYDTNQPALNRVYGCKTEFELPQTTQMQQIFPLKDADSVISYV